MGSRSCTGIIVSPSLMYSINYCLFVWVLVYTRMGYRVQGILSEEAQGIIGKFYKSNQRKGATSETLACRVMNADLINTDEMMQKTQCTTRFVHFIVGISRISHHVGKMVAYIDKITLCSETLQYTVPCLLNSACVKLSTNVQRWFLGGSMNLIGLLPSLLTVGTVWREKGRGRIERDFKWAGLRAGDGLKDGEWPWGEPAKGEEMCGR